MKPHIGDEVVFVGSWNSFLGQRGRVTANEPHLMVLVDGETHAMRFDRREVMLVIERETSMTGAE